MLTFPVILRLSVFTLFADFKCFLLFLSLLALFFIGNCIALSCIFVHRYELSCVDKLLLCCCETWHVVCRLVQTLGDFLQCSSSTRDRPTRDVSSFEHGKIGFFSSYFKEVYLPKSRLFN